MSGVGARIAVVTSRHRPAGDCRQMDVVPVAEQRDVEQTVVVDVAPERVRTPRTRGERVGGVD